MVPVVTSVLSYSSHQKIKFIPMKIHKTVATRAAPFGPDMHQIICRLTGGAYSAPPEPLAGFQGPTSKGSEGRRRGGEEKGKGEGRRKGRGREGKEKGRGGRRGEGKELPPYAIGTPHFLDQRYAPV